MQEPLDLTDVATYGYRAERWNFVEGEALVGIIAKLNKEQNRHVINAATCRVVWRMLPFYPGATLVRVIDFSWRPHGMTLYFFGMRGQYRRLDGSRHLLTFINAHAPLKLTAQNIAEYLKFFCYFVRYRGRPFILVERSEDIGSCEPALSQNQIDAIEPFLKPIALLADHGNKGYMLSASVRYHDLLFKAAFEVDGAGQVRMVEDEVMGAYLPVPTGPAAAPAWGAAA